MTSLPTTTTTHIPAYYRPEGMIRPAPAAAQPPAGGISLAQILSMLRRHVWLMAVLFVGVQLVTWGSFFYFYRFHKEYTARGQMKLTNLASLTPISLAGDRAPDPGSLDMRAREETAKLLSEDNLMRFLNESETQKFLTDPANQNLAWIRATRGEVASALVDEFRKRLSANPTRDSGVQISFKDSNPGAAAAVVNLLMRYYRGRTSMSKELGSEDAKSAIAKELRENLRPQSDDLKAQIEKVRQAEEFAKEGLDVSRSVVQQRVDQMNAKFIEYKLVAEATQQVARKIKEQFGDPHAEPSKEMVARVDAYPAVTALQSHITVLEEEKRILVEIRLFGREHRVVREIDARIDQTYQTMTAKKAALLEMEKAQTVAGSQAAADSTETTLKKIQQELDDALNQRRDLTNLWQKYQGLLGEKARVDAKIGELEDRLRQIQMNENRGLPGVDVLFAAAVPRRDDYTSPDWTLFLGSGLFIGLALAVGLVFLIELADTSVRTTRDLSDQVRLPLLGFVPLVEGPPQAVAQIARLAAREPMSMVAECFRHVRTNLLFAAPVDQLSSLLVTSATSAEGKTFVATNLAITIGLSGRKVLLIDANFRRPALAGIFNLPGNCGLSNVLTNQATLAEAARPVDSPGLTVMTTGPMPPNPAELLGGPTLRVLLDQACAQFDLVMFDGPPGLLVSDTLVLATAVDGAVAVVRASETSRGMVHRLREQLGRVNARIIGAVLNAARSTRGGYFRKSFQAYAEYQNEPAVSPDGGAAAPVVADSPAKPTTNGTPTAVAEMPAPFVPPPRSDQSEAPDPEGPARPPDAPPAV